MDSSEYFLVNHAAAHTGALLGVPPDRMYYEDRLTAGLAEEEMRACPHGLNSIAWLLWHIARTEDAAANVVIAGRRQVLDDGDWPAQLRVARRDIGTGMTSEEVAQLSTSIDIPAMRAYRLAVGRRTRDIVRALTPADWTRTIERSRIEQGFAEGLFLPDATWPFSFWGGQSVTRLLVWPCSGHSLMHLGQAMWSRRLVHPPR